MTFSIVRMLIFFGFATLALASLFVVYALLTDPLTDLPDPGDLHDRD